MARPKRVRPALRPANVVNGVKRFMVKDPLIAGFSLFPLGQWELGDLVR